MYQLILKQNKMKKIILSAAAIFAFGFANAQEMTTVTTPITSSKGEEYLPKAGDWAIGFSANTFFDYLGNAFSGSTSANTMGTPVNDGWNGTFVGKKFTTDATANRYLIDLGVHTGSTTTPSTTVSTQSTKVTTSNVNVAVGLGKEWRKGKTRLQGFYGADVVLGVNTGNTKTENTDSAGGPFNMTTEVKNGLGLMVGARGFLGAEYFVFPKIAIGAQYTYNVMLDVSSAAETTMTTPTSSTTTKGAKSFNFDLGNVGVASLSLTLHF